MKGWKAEEAPEGLTLLEWMEWRKAQDMDCLEAIRRMLEDAERGVMALAERIRTGATLQ